MGWFDEAAEWKKQVSKEDVQNTIKMLIHESGLRTERKAGEVGPKLSTGVTFFLDLRVLHPFFCVLNQVLVLLGPQLFQTRCSTMSNFAVNSQKPLQ